EGPILQEAVLLASALAFSPPSGLRTVLLDRLAAGDLAGALVFGADAPCAAWPAPALAARAAGSDFVLEGACPRVRVTGDPQGLLGSVRTAEEMVLGWLPRETGNLEVRQVWLVDGTAGCELRLQGVRLAGRMVLARGEQASSALAEALDRGTVMAAAALLG